MLRRPAGVAKAALLLAVLIAGAALAAPAPILRIDAAGRSAELALGADGRFTYSYRQSIYDVPVVEEQRAEDAHLRVLAARSPDRRAVEYFRWPGEPRADGDSFTQDAPDVTAPRLLIRVTPDARQTIAAVGSVDLLAAFGEAVVEVFPATVPRAWWLLAAAGGSRDAAAARPSHTDQP